MKTEGPPLEPLLRRLAECPAEFQLAPWLEDSPEAAMGHAGTLHVDALLNDWLAAAGYERLAAHEAAVYRSVQAAGARNPALVAVRGAADSAGQAAAAAAAAAGAGGGKYGKGMAKARGASPGAAPSSSAAAASAKQDGSAAPASLSAQAAAVRAWLRVLGPTVWLLYDTALLRGGSAAGDARRAAILDFLDDELAELSRMVEPATFVSDGDRREELVRRTLRALDMRPVGESRPHAEDRMTTLDTVEMRRVAIASRIAEERARAIREAMARKAAEEAAATYNRE
ncbi:hypothetical protein DB346_10640 [Verrucomicrobia bacterium LW23]|nr:hypothetical protein DB346_10640 [Verrucomicrobia bacterium LW23]